MQNLSKWEVPKVQQTVTVGLHSTTVQVARLPGRQIADRLGVGGNNWHNPLVNPRVDSYALMPRASMLSSSQISPHSSRIPCQRAHLCSYSHGTQPPLFVWARLP
jgi:hypothetical protein